MFTFRKNTVRGRPLKMSAQNREKLTLSLSLFPQNVRTGSIPSPLSMRTHHKFRKIPSFRTKNADVRILRTPLVCKISALDSPLPWRQTSFTLTLLVKLILQISPEEKKIQICHMPGEWWQIKSWLKSVNNQMTETRDGNRSGRDFSTDWPDRKKKKQSKIRSNFSIF